MLGLHRVIVDRATTDTLQQPVTLLVVRRLRLRDPFQAGIGIDGERVNVDQAHAGQNRLNMDEISAIPSPEPTSHHESPDFLP